MSKQFNAFCVVVGLACASLTLGGSIAVAGQEVVHVPVAASSHPPLRHEVVSMRTEKARVFANDAGQHTAELFATPVHYRGSDGQMLPIDSRLVDANDSAFSWQNPAGAFAVRFKGQSGGSVLTFRVGARSFSLALKGAAARSGEAAGNAVTYDGVFPGVDLRYELLPDGFKESLVLSQADVPRVYEFELRPEAGTPDLSVEPQANGSWSLVSDGAAWAALEPPRITDALGRPLAGNAADLDVRTVGSALHVSLRLDDQWLRKHAKRLPLVVDPTTVVQPTSADATTFPWCPTCNIDSAAPRFSVGYAGQEDLTRGVAKFDLSVIPSDADVVSAQAEFYFDGTCVADCGGWPIDAREITIHRVTNPWTAASQSSAITFDSDTEGSQTFAAPFTARWLTWNMTGLVQRWAAGDVANHGFVLKLQGEPPAPINCAIEPCNQQSGPTLLSSRYTADATLRPRLTVTWAAADDDTTETKLGGVYELDGTPPSDLVSDGDGLYVAGSVGEDQLADAASDETSQASDLVRMDVTTKHPRRAVVKVTLTSPGGSSFCTGFMISKDTVALAAHCLYDRLQDPTDITLNFEPVTLAPGQNGTVKPYGECDDYDVFIARAWKRSLNPRKFVPGWDYGAVKLEAGCDIGNRTGVMQLHRMSDTVIVGKKMLILGYPGDRDAGLKMYRSGDQVRKIQKRQIFFSNEVENGMSGGPAYRYCQFTQRWCAIGIVTTKRGPGSPYPGNVYNAGVRFHEKAQNNLHHYRKCLRQAINACEPS